jgi:DnaJ-class molecular chaperone
VSDRIICPDCDGRQIVFRGEVLTDCPTCDGRGYTTIVAAAIQPAMLVLSALVVALGVGWIATIIWALGR